MLLNNQSYVSTSRGMPVETLDDSQRVESITGETVQLYYDNAGTLTIDAGQAAGVVVVGKLAQGTVLNELTDTPANENDTSLSFTSTALTNEVGLPTEYDNYDRSSSSDRMTYYGQFLSNGDFCVDYVHGVIYGKKASVQVTLTATSYKIPVRGGSSALPLGSVTVTNNVTVQGDIAHDAVDSGNPLKIGGRARTTQMAPVTQDQRVDAAFTTSGEQIVAGYSYTNQNIRVAETDPISTHHNEAILANVTDGADDTYYYYVDMDGYSNLGLQLTLDGGTGNDILATVEASIQDDGTAQASCAYQDVTTDAYGVAAFTATDMLNDSAGFFGQFKFVRVKIVANSGDDTADWTIFSKKKY